MELRGFLRLLLTVISLAVAPARSATTIYQAESATIFHGVVESTNSGSTGAGYVNYNDEVGSYVEWTVNATQSGIYRLAFRHANGTSTNRPMAIVVNQATAYGSLAFLGTGSWSTWLTQGFNANLTAGTNTIRAAATTSSGGPNVDRLEVSDQPPPTFDWSRAIVDSTMQRFPTASSFGSWTYYRGLYLYGQVLVYRRTGDSRYLQYARDWVDDHVDSSGNIDTALDSLDSMAPGLLLLALHEETGDSRYRLAADRIRQRLDTYPRTSDGGFWHSTDRTGQLWLDGMFMSMPFLVHYGQLFGDSAYANDEAADQLSIYASHLKHASNGLLYHAYDEQGDPSWADPVTHRSPEFWCRALGWYGMALIEVLEILPVNHPQKSELVGIVRDMVEGLANHQDVRTGLWYQVVDKETVTNNWHETSCSGMHASVAHRAVQRGYVDPTCEDVAGDGRRGALSKLYLGSDSLTYLTEISEGTQVGDLAYYLARARNVNDLRGLGPFLVMNEQTWTPVARSTPVLGVERTQLTWSGHCAATSYDVVRGDLSLLRTSGGDFASSTLGCLANDTAALTLPYSANPLPGSGFWFLLRGVRCGGTGSYDSSSPRQVESRDAEVAASGLDCAAAPACLP